MKLEKALNKAKQKRLQSLEAVNEKLEDEGLQAPAALRKGPWRAPVYSQSTCLVADSVTAIANRCVCLQRNAPAMDCYKVLRTRLMQRMQPNGWNTVMVTSVRPGEGKTLTTINLALTFAMAHSQTVLLLDCDLRNQSVYRLLGIDSNRGIADYLIDERPLSDLIIWPKIEKLTLISGGRNISQSAELLGSPRMRELMAEMKSRYSDRYLIVDAPPILVGADTLTLAPLVDGIVVVIESSGPPLKEIQESLSLIPREKFLGFVLNKHTSRRNGYYQYYKDA
jgi:protein-tyrosine kinase